METTKVALENERKIQQLQMQAINALWKKVSTLQPPTNGTEMTTSTTSLSGIETSSTAVVQDLAKTCSVLTNQVNFINIGFGLARLNNIFFIYFRFNNCKDQCGT